jgi:hypothetical protein
VIHGSAAETFGPICRCHECTFDPFNRWNICQGFHDSVWRSGPVILLQKYRLPGKLVSCRHVFPDPLTGATTLKDSAHPVSLQAMVFHPCSMLNMFYRLVQQSIQEVRDLGLGSMFGAASASCLSHRPVARSRAWPGLLGLTFLQRWLHIWMWLRCCRVLRSSLPSPAENRPREPRKQSESVQLPRKWTCV